MKKLYVFLALFVCVSLITFTGCSETKKKEPAPAPRAETDTVHLTAEDNGLSMSVSKDIRALSALNTYAKEGNQIVSIQVAIENNSSNNVPISPEFVTLKTTDDQEYKYSAQLTEKITSKASFRKVTLPKEYRGGGLLIFEIKKGVKSKTLTYNDNAGHNITIKFPSSPKTNV